MTRRPILIFLLIAFAGIAAAEPAAELPSYRPVPGLAGALHSVGSNKLDVITFGWIQLFRKYYAGARLTATIEARGLFTAAPALLDGSADVAPTPLPFSPREIEDFRQRYGYPPLGVRVCGGSYALRGDSNEAIAIYVNRRNPLAQLTLAQLDAIYSASRRRGAPKSLERWGQLGLGGEWAGRPIVPYGSRMPNAMGSAFRALVLLYGDVKPSVRERGPEDGGPQSSLAAVVAAVASDSNGIGVAGFSQAIPDVRALPLGETDAGPFVAGSPQSVLDRTYPLARYCYLYVNRAPGHPLPPVVREFLKLALSREGQAVVADDGVSLPLPPAIAREELAKIE